MDFVSSFTASSHSDECQLLIASLNDVGSVFSQIQHVIIRDD
jgi:hypothetical protein